MPNVTLRDGIGALGVKSLGIIEGWLNGAPGDPARVRVAERMILAATKMEHLDQLRDQARVSNGLRLAHLLANPEARQQYVDLMRPTITSNLLAAPEKRKALPK